MASIVYFLLCFVRLQEIVTIVKKFVWQPRPLKVNGRVTSLFSVLVFILLPLLLNKFVLKIFFILFMNYNILILF